MKPNTYRRMLAVVITWLAVGTLLSAVTAQSPQAAPATAPVLTRPLPTEPDDYDLSWAKLVRTFGADFGEHLPDLVGDRVFCGEGVGAGSDGDLPVAA